MNPRTRHRGRTRDAMTLDDFANKDILDVDDVRYMKNIWPEEYPAVAAAKLAERVERAPQYCRFLTFERLNLLRLYKLQHDILTYLPESEEDVAPGTQLLTRPEPSLLMTPAPQQRRFAGNAASSSQPMVKDGYSGIGIIEGHLDEKLMALIQEYSKLESSSLLSQPHLVMRTDRYQTKPSAHSKKCNPGPGQQAKVAR